MRRARQRGPARWTAFGWSATHSTVTSVGDAPCITHDLIGQHSCGRPQVDFKAVFLTRSTSPDTATPPGAVQIRLRCLENGFTPHDQGSELGGASICRSGGDGAWWGNDSPIARAKSAYSGAIYRNSGRFESASRGCCSTLTFPEASHTAHKVHWSRLLHGPRQERERRSPRRAYGPQNELLEMSLGNALPGRRHTLLS